MLRPLQPFARHFLRPSPSASTTTTSAIAAATTAGCAGLLLRGSFGPLNGFEGWRIPSGVRTATHKASSPANKAKDGPGKRLGAKKTAGELVKPGMIIYRQRGTLWFPGENAGMGRDHTIFAKEYGYVRYYRDPAYPSRKYIGIALKEEYKLPTPPGAARRRRLGKTEVDYFTTERTKWEEEVYAPQIAKAEKGEVGVGIGVAGEGTFRSPNWLLGRVPQVTVRMPYDKKNTWRRWQKRVEKKAYAIKMRGPTKGKKFKRRRGRR